MDVTIETGPAPTPAPARRADAAPFRRPRLPAQLVAPSFPLALAVVGTSVGVFVAGGVLATWASGAALPLALRVVLVAAGVLVAAHGAHLCGFVGHEGIHLNLHPNRWVSVVLGTFVSAMTSFSAIGYGIAHWNHHRFTNQGSDPDAQLYAPLRTFWSRFLRARVNGNRSHQRNMIRMALGKPLALGYKLPFSARAQRRLAWMNVAMLALWLATYAAIAVVAPRFVIFGVVLPILVLVPMSGLRGYLEHAGTRVGPFRDTRSYAAPFYTALFLGNNFHLEHHLYPGVPCYRLPAVHRFLRAEGWFAHWQSPIETTVWGALRHTTAASQYPDAKAPDSADDPFLATARERVSAAA
ncbi:MAG: fatty acid desaturase [bacterium]|nr:fatty acid desaturase [bacterium]